FLSRVYPFYKKSQIKADITIKVWIEQNLVELKNNRVREGKEQTNRQLRLGKGKLPIVLSYLFLINQRSCCFRGNGL
ncbi:hypothetical protein, partial [Enterococcus pallens]|uniref:hypothetical protein n=1 Tax=Enterococcus pallens TaxID=160454 RepID=UPI001B80D7FA